MQKLNTLARMGGKVNNCFLSCFIYIFLAAKLCFFKKQKQKQKNLDYRTHFTASVEEFQAK